MRILNQTFRHAYGFTKTQMKSWRILNNIPEYVNASYDGYTGVKTKNFSIYTSRKNLPDITEDFKAFEENVLNEIKEVLDKPLGYIRALWKVSQNFGTGERWDTKFLPEFPGRTKKGEKQYAKYKGHVVSGNDISNILYGHVCKFLHIPSDIAKFIAKIDAAGLLEPISKGKLPTLELLKFRDTASDQKAIEMSIKTFNINDYRFKNSQI